MAIVYEVESPMQVREERTVALPKSLTSHAVSEIRALILSGELAEGERLIEQQLTDMLGISRPPLREAMRILEIEGFITTEARRGSRVVSLSEQDVFEVLTLRAAYERLAVELGVPVKDPARLAKVRTALANIEACAAAGDRPGIVEAGYAFHSSIVGLAGHSRLEEAYEAVHLQVLLCMARNLVAHERQNEDMHQNAERHRTLLEAIETGDQELVLRSLANHGDRAFLKNGVS
jgi:DNA-binding GntR family transcriptional regulator